MRVKMSAVRNRGVSASRSDKRKNQIQGRLDTMRIFIRFLSVRGLLVHSVSQSGVLNRLFILWLLSLMTGGRASAPQQVFVCNSRSRAHLIAKWISNALAHHSLTIVRPPLSARTNKV